MTNEEMMQLFLNGWTLANIADKPEPQPAEPDSEVTRIRAMIGDVITDIGQLRAGMTVCVRTGCSRTGLNPETAARFYIESVDDKRACGRFLVIDAAWIADDGVILLAYDPPSKKPVEMIAIAAKAMQKEEARITGKARKAIEYFIAQRPADIVNGAQAKQPAKCAPGCEPAKPCMGSVCPGREEQRVWELMRHHTAETNGYRASREAEARQWRSQQWEPLTNGTGAMVGRYRYERRR